MYEFDSRYPMGINLTMAKTFGKGLGSIQPSQAHLFPGGMGQIVPSEAHIFGEDLNGIENCGIGCQIKSLGNVQLAGRPWWHWLAIGAGIGGALYMMKRSGLIGNPAEMTDEEAIQQAAALAVQAQIPVILWGPPGIGKTSWLEALGKAMGAEVFTVIGSTKDPADIGGVMTTTGRLIPPAWASDILERSKKGLKSVLFLDEFSSMTPLVQAAMLRVVRDKVAGETNFDPTGKYVHVVCAANKPEQGAGSIDLPPPAANRLIHLDWPTPNPLTWGLGIITGKWPVPKLDVLGEGWKKSSAMRRAKDDIISFVEKRREFMMRMPVTEKAAGEAWPSPRSWEMAAEALGAAYYVGNYNPKEKTWDNALVQYKLVAGAVGDDVAGEFFIYRNKKRDLPSPEKILKDPTGWVPPEDRGDVVFAVANSVVRAVREKPTEKRFVAAIEFILYMADITGRKDTMGIAASELFKIRAENKFQFPENLQPDFKKHFGPLMVKAKGGKKKVSR